MFERSRARLASWLLPKQMDEQEMYEIFGIAGQQTAAPRGLKDLFRAYRDSPWLRAVVGKIATRYAATEWKLYVPTSGQGRAIRRRDIQQMHFSERRKTFRRLKQSNELEEIVNHPLLDLINSANTSMTGLQARALTQIYRDLSGEAFWWLGYGMFNVPTQFWPLAPHWVKDVPSERSPYFDVDIRGQAFKIPANEIVWFREPDPYDPYGRGIGIGQALGDEVEADEFAAKFIKTVFLNRGRPELMVSVKGANGDKLKAAKQEFENQHRGLYRAMRSFWHSGDMKVEKIDQSFDELQMSDLRKWERDAIINVYGVPPEQLGIVSNSNRATAQVSEETMAKSVLEPRLEDMRDNLQENLVPLYDERLIIDFVSPVPADRDYQLEAMKANPSTATVREWRELQGLDDRGPDDNVHLLETGLTVERPPSEQGMLPPSSGRTEHVIDAEIEEVGGDTE